MNSDLKIIKKYFGEQMAYLCRELFSTIIDNHPGELASILREIFADNHYLYNDLMRYEMHGSITSFKNYVYMIYEKKHKKKDGLIDTSLNPFELMRKVGYTLYECKTYEDINKFRKYYTDKEMLCTFTGGERLRSNYVYFAVKDGADKLKRSDFINPKRQDEYGISVISIQFTRDDSHTLSIKNRYNHTVENPDATFANNLDNIIPGLTQSFAKFYGIRQLYYTSSNFEIPEYVRANDGKLYKYNYEIDNVYYCPENIIIDNYKVTKYPKEKYLVLDYFLIDLVNKTITSKVKDSFLDTFGKIKNITIKNEQDNKIIIITPEDGEDIILRCDKLNRLISVVNNNVSEIGNNFLQYIWNIKKISLNNVKKIGDNFFPCNKYNLEIIFPNVLEIGNDFLINGNISKIELPNVQQIGSKFLLYNLDLKKINFPKLTVIKNEFLLYNKTLEEIKLPRVKVIGDSFLENNHLLMVINLPEVERIGNYFCYGGECLWKVSLPKLKEIGQYAMFYNHDLFKLEIPDTAIIGNGFLKRSNYGRKRRK